MASYLRPDGLADALAALPRVVVAGGTDHYPTRAAWEPAEDILDITGIAALRGIARTGDMWRIGALTTWTELADAPLPPLLGGVQAAARQIGGRQIQNTGTVAGNLCNASPAADGVPALLALDATVELASTAGLRQVALADFIQGPRRTARTGHEIVTAILVPHRAGRGYFHKLGGRRYLVISIAMVGMAMTLDPGGRVAWVAVAVGACGPVATRLLAVEAALLGQHPDPELVRPDHLDALTPIDDMRAPAAYRRTAALELVRRGVVELAR